MQTISNAIQINHCLLKTVLQNAKLVIDATCGNGSDTLFLAENSPVAKIYAFDIQPAAVENTKQQTLPYKNKITYICDSHSNVKKYIKQIPIDVAVFNLGYLPGAPHLIMTHTKTTLETLDIMRQLLKTNGIISITAYPGHTEGKREYNALLNYTKAMDKHTYTVGWYQLHNHIDAPALCWIEKQG
ncbi:class I SAM-dependent methyltransferase [Pectinatus frisingensis]|jgi:SAM-dependent methyltransferase|uniref:class I SAM-dependent methyltransferase n=1 Tax=Pectinatus frisingensis TaxID=865 RepID=UPI0015F75438|nr:class I SAM-dependent methyltransferase [Pectinatus frisingensis]